MLSEDDLARIRAEETFRHQLRKSFAPKPAKGLKALLQSDTAKWVVVTLITPLFAAIWTFGIGAFQREQDFARKDIDQLTELLPGLSGNATQQELNLIVLDGLTAGRDAKSPLVVAQQKIRTRLERSRNSGDPAQATDAVAKIEALLQATGDVSPINSAAPETAAQEALNMSVGSSAFRQGQFAYLQIYREDQRPQANALADRLRASGLPVPGIENVTNKYAGAALKYPQLGALNVRFYHAQDRDAAQAVATTAASSGVPAPTVSDLSGRETKGKAGTLEVWFACANDRQSCERSVQPSQTSRGAQ